ncbi:MAG: RdgB/HAM1 family non-canonical purine NTP pyrophosphatase [Bacteroides sp.]|nr:RdgB/HAM1 family non-canonical purine NTP pyrophosphatase [Bacteroides sp.]
MTEKRKLVMATNNAGKLHEARAIVGDRLEILSLDDIGYHHDIEETADTLEDNALIKVRAIKDATGFDCFADDTGLMVDALGGAPGVHTARYAGDECDPDANMELLLHNLEGAADRSARFRTCVALSLDGEEHTFMGEVEGSIATERSGSHGFGYDPVFIPEETGVCFAEMTDEAKNAISHRGRALSAMMRWISALCLCIFCVFGADAASTSADWRLYNTFDDKVDHIFDTPSKTYFLVQPQLYASVVDNSEKILFLFCKDKESGEIRPYNSQNFLSRTLISKANYNARKNYLLLVYDDLTIDFLHDDGSLHSSTALKNYNSGRAKDVRSISFDPDLDRVYLATDFGYVILDDEKYEVSSSGIYNEPIDRIARVSDRFVILRNKRLYQDDANSNHLSLSDFSEVDWGGNGDAEELIPLTDDRCLISRKADGKNPCYIIDFGAAKDTPNVKQIGNLDSSNISENRDGIMFTRYGSIFQLDRDADSLYGYVLRDEETGQPCGSWDFRNFHYSKPREGFYSIRIEDDKSWTVTSQPARPNVPAVFRSDDLMFSSMHGMLANTHGLSQNFTSDFAKNPILLSGLKDQEWTMYGVPYHDTAMQYRLINPCGMAQDPDNPDVFYFGSVYNGILRYNIKDMSSLLHITKSDDAPNEAGHVSIQDPYSGWKNIFSLTSPVFDSRGNLLVAHLNGETTSPFSPELWIWTPEDRRASTSPDTFRPFARLKIEDTSPNTANKVIPLSYPDNQNMVVFLPINYYKKPLVVYDHNGTPHESSDDRQTPMKDLEDADGKLDVIYLYCAIEDPQTGLVWVGSDDGVFTFDPRDAFTNPGYVSRIKVSRNDGTSLADYLLAGTAVNNISIDGQGRKWFSLSGGGLVCTSADGKTIIQEIDSENSMLPSDMVYASCYNPDNNSMMIATSAGLCEYYFTAQTNEAVVSDVRAYPNPVRHDYYGWVTIDGLEDDCIVKITDSAGNIVRELGPAVAGKVQWDVCGMDLNRVPSGVYFVLASSGPGGGSYSEATKILVINR